MLSILQNQAKKLEEELKALRKELLRAKHEKTTMADKLTLTEEELAELKERFLHEMLKEKNAQADSGVGDDKPISQSELGELQSQVS